MISNGARLSQMKMAMNKGGFHRGPKSWKQQL